MDRRTNIIFFASVLLASAAAAFYVTKTKSKRVRRYKCRPMNRNRRSEGQFYTLVKIMVNLENDLEQYVKYTRMTPKMFNELLELVGPQLVKDRRGDSLSPAHRLTMTLHYLAEGCSMQEIARGFRVGKATVYVIVNETCEVLWTTLQPLVLGPPTQDQWQNIERGFFNRWNMPNCLGAVDGKHVEIQCPSLSGSQFFNYKKFLVLC